MAIKIDDEKYIKLDIDKCYIDRKGVHIAYYIYNDEKTRIEEETRENNLTAFLTKLSDKMESLINPLMTKYADKKIANDEEFLAVLTKAEKKNYELWESLQDDYSLIFTSVKSGQTREEKELKNLAVLKELGFTSSLLENTTRHIQLNTVSSVYMGQKLSYDDMYKELKKLFKDEKITNC